MSATQRIFLYGNSVILGSIGASLLRCSQFDVTMLTKQIQSEKSFDIINPDILLFDLEAPCADDAFFWLKTNPAPLLIGVSPGTNVVRVWHSQQIQGISMQGLIVLIKNIQP